MEHFEKKHYLIVIRNIDSVEKTSSARLLNPKPVQSSWGGGGGKNRLLQEALDFQALPSQFQLVWTSTVAVINARNFMKSMEFQAKVC